MHLYPAAQPLRDFTVRHDGDNPVLLVDEHPQKRIPLPGANLYRKEIIEGAELYRLVPVAPEIPEDDEPKGDPTEDDPVEDDEAEPLEEPDVDDEQPSDEPDEPDDGEPEQQYEQVPIPESDWIEGVHYTWEPIPEDEQIEGVHYALVPTPWDEMRLGIDYELQPTEPYIAAWHLDEPQPTTEQLADAWDDYEANKPEPPPTPEQRIGQLEQTNAAQQSVIDMLVLDALGGGLGV